MERKINVWLLENIKPKWTIESRVTQAAFSVLNIFLKFFFIKWGNVFKSHIEMGDGNDNIYSVHKNKLINCPQLLS